MYCRKCGAQIPSDSDFCPKCGASQGTGSSGSGSADSNLEIAEVEVEQVGAAWFVLHVVSVGPEGEQLVFSAEKFKAKPRPMTYYIEDGISRILQAPDSAGDAIREITSHMGRNGWSPLPRGQHWYSYRFQRVVASAQVAQRSQTHRHMDTLPPPKKVNIDDEIQKLKESHRRGEISLAEAARRQRLLES